MFQEAVPSFKEIECFNMLKGWRLHFAWLRLKEGDHQATLRLAVEGTIGIFKKKFSENSYFDEPIVNSVRSLLREGGLSPEIYLSSFELLAEKVLAGEEVQTEKHGVVFRDLLSLKSLVPWSIIDILKVRFPFTFRMGREGEILQQANSSFNLKGWPVLCDQTGRMYTPISLADGDDLPSSCKEILLVCYAPLERAREVAAKSHLGNLVHMTQIFRFVMERAFLPERV